jgi:hypothetical protein
LGYWVLEAASGPASLQLAESHRDPIDLLVIEIMPQLEGKTLHVRLSQSRSGLKALFISGCIGKPASISACWKPDWPSCITVRGRPTGGKSPQGAGLQRHEDASQFAYPECHCSLYSG